MLKNHCQTQDNKNILLYFLLEAKKCFTFKLIMSNFQLLSWKVYLYVYILFFFINSPIIPVPFVEKNILSPLNYLCSFEKYYLTIFVLMYFWALYTISLTYLGILFLIHTIFTILIIALYKSWRQSLLSLLRFQSDG